MGIIFAVLSGTFIALQGIFNAKLGYAVGAWLSVTIVHFVGLILALGIYAFKRDADMTAFRRVPWYYSLGGLFGVFVVFGELTAIQRLGVTWAICVLLVAQLIGAFLIDLNGWFGVKKKPVNQGQIMGLALMVVGIGIYTFT
ncbi:MULTISPECIES: DMT family transporter [Exiguobacterium]|uniref:DMT family transporter n=1 Tax=Exiguobacterium TaxID=33986 RepID=UPI0008775FB4|nr:MULTISPECIES: DMT family transporter [Exiguobacterium]TCI34456.1 DMT family transporter [Exiguobacterium sp. SH4S7]TCI44210.1 DMT family transporter [Exiguobacterium sp. SH5S32]TCI50476.1 DMT family transporter [Exiguobacterium sp. SH1S4]TCI52937.1 DMT family transporter [Exiguobacterium sp. SH1S21]TCI60529.1 DMT family transporter [Exiguobacterium sp. SH0S2]